MSEAEQIAAKLTEAQRKVLLYVCYEFAATRLYGSQFRTGDALKRRGLADWIDAPEHNSAGAFVLAPLGLAVRQILQGDQ